MRRDLSSDKTKLRVIHLISGDLWAGAEMQAWQTLVGLQKYCDLELMCILFNDGILADHLRQTGIKTLIISEKDCSAIGITRILAHHVSEYQPSVLHVHHIKEHFTGLLTKLLNATSCPLIRTMHGLSGVPPHLPFLKHIRSSVVVGLDHLLVHFFCQGIIAVSKDLEANLKQRRPNGKIWQINNSLELESEQFKKIQKRENEIRQEFHADSLFWICIPARLVAPKNLGLIVEAGAILRQTDLPFHISIFGDGPLRNKIQSQIMRLGLQEEITLHGFRADILEIVNAADLFVLCSSHEGLPMALLESMALQKAVVCTAVGGMKEVIQDGVNGLLIPPNNPDALATAIIRIMKDTGLAKSIAANARKTIEENYSIKKTSQELFTLYSYIVQQ